MKRKLALFLVLAMVLSLVPVNVFAASSSSMSKIPSVSDDQDWTPADTAEAPKLKIKEVDEAFGTETQTFQLALTNGEWTEDLIDEDDLAITATGADLTGDDYTVERISDTKINIELTFTANDADTDAVISIPMLVSVGDEGKVEVKITAIDAATSLETETVCNVVGGDTNTEIDGTVTIGDSATDINTIVIEELAAGTVLATEPIKIKLLDNDFEWVTYNENAGTEINFSGGFSAQADEEADGYTINEGDEHILILPTLDAESTSRGIISLAGLKVKPNNDANYGEIKAKVYDADTTEQTIVIGTYSDFGITAAAADEKEADLPTIYAGTKDDTTSNLIIEETVEGSWLLARSTTVTLPDSIKIVDVTVADSENFDTVPTITIDDNTFDIENGVATDGEKVTLELEITVSVEANATPGDLVAKVSGRSLVKELSAKLGDIKLPFTTTYTSADIKIGVQDQAAGKIVITEAEDGILEPGDIIVFELSDLDFDNEGEVKVTKGDIEMNDPEVNDGILSIEVDNDSTEVSTFEITGMTVDVNRSIPEGKITVKVKDQDETIIENFDADGTDPEFDTDYFQKLNALTVITPAPGDTQAGEKVVFTIGSADYMIGAVKFTSDVAPYINEQGRTMLPLRVLANALGVEDRNIIWNDAEHSVVIFKGDATLKVIIGQMFFNKNGVLVPMDTQAVIMNSRTFLPLRAMGEALGAIVTWDEATRTVTIN